MKVGIIGLGLMGGSFALDIKKPFPNSEIFGIDSSSKNLDEALELGLIDHKIDYKDLNEMDLIFVDGGHTYSVVKNDSEKSFEMLNSNGIILWHDYVPGKRSAEDVVKYINEISKQKKIYKIKNTSLCVFMNKREVTE